MYHEKTPAPGTRGVGSARSERGASVRDKAKAPSASNEVLRFSTTQRPETRLRDGGFGPLISERLLGRFLGPKNDPTQLGAEGSEKGRF